ncbi:hypothetical protein PENTCL1PPCAC_3822, partial [Pristionchus entomophagus]
EVGGTQWALVASTDWDQEHLDAFLVLMGDQSSMRNVEVPHKLSLINHDDDAKTVIVKHVRLLTESFFSFGSRCIVKWSDVIDKEKSFIKDNKFTLQVKFWLSKIDGFRSSPFTRLTSRRCSMMISTRRTRKKSS